MVGKKSRDFIMARAMSAAAAAAASLGFAHCLVGGG